MQYMILISITISTCNRLSLESVIYSIFNITGFSRIIISYALLKSLKVLKQEKLEVFIRKIFTSGISAYWDE